MGAENCDRRPARDRLGLGRYVGFVVLGQRRPGAPGTDVMSPKRMGPSSSGAGQDVLRWRVVAPKSQRRGQREARGTLGEQGPSSAAIIPPKDVGRRRAPGSRAREQSS